MKLRNYFVEFSIDIKAASPQAAASEAEQFLLRQDMRGTYRVTNDAGTAVLVDLETGDITDDKKETE